MVVRRHVLPPSNEDATTSSRPLYTGTMSCFQVATMLRGFLGLTTMAGSTTRPSIFSSSWNAPGQPAGNGVGPETVVSSGTLAGGRTWAVALPPQQSRPQSMSGGQRPTSSRQPESPAATHAAVSRSSPTPDVQAADADRLTFGKRIGVHGPALRSADIEGQCPRCGEVRC